MSTKKIYSIDQVKAHGHLMQRRFRDRSLKFEYYDLKMGWQDASVPQWVAETCYRAVDGANQAWRKRFTNKIQ